MPKKGKLDPVIEDYLKNDLNQTMQQYIENAVWSTFRETVDNKQAPLRKQIEDAIMPDLIRDAYAWKMNQEKNNSVNPSSSNKHF